jgi:membrane protein
MVRRAEAEIESLERRGQEWEDRQDPASVPGVCVGAWRCYQWVDGQLQTALLSLYIMIAVLPALLVMDAYFQSDPAALAKDLIRHYGLNASAAALVRGVLVADKQHVLVSALIAAAGVLIAGVGFGRVLQLVHVRAWRLRHDHSGLGEQFRFAAVLLGLYVLIMLLLFQLKELSGAPPWAAPLVAPGWVVVVAGFFVWAPWMLTHKRIHARDLVPGAVLTALGLVALMLASSFVGQLWLNFYANGYGGLGVVLAIYFWIVLGSAVIVWTASLSPSLAERRALRAIAARRDDPPPPHRNHLHWHLHHHVDHDEPGDGAA